ncbi:DUF29 domain-containing protein [Limnospira platensis CENA597]|uniref:DUF29 domain-containing protein n=1 Tax=Limnospira platensis TaxID=118562 RepID=UPI003D6F193E
MTLSKQQLTTLYCEDYVLWIEETLEQLRDRNYDQVDWENLLEEIEDMSKRERSSLRSNLAMTLLHLLKWEFQPELRTGSWAGSITEHRTRILDILEDSPSLKNYLPEAILWAYPRTRRQGKNETGLPLEVFPAECPYAIADILNDDFLPGEDENGR